jgi:hypothetical protein
MQEYKNPLGWIVLLVLIAIDCFFNAEKKDNEKIKHN